MHARTDEDRALIEGGMAPAPEYLRRVLAALLRVEDVGREILAELRAARSGEAAPKKKGA
jgi:hypothetical protein